MRRGRLRLLAQRLDFTRGRLTFAGELKQELDFVGETRAGDVTAQIAVKGPAVEPTFAFTSQPRSAAGRNAVADHVPEASGGLRKNAQAPRLALGFFLQSVIPQQ